MRNHQLDLPCSIPRIGTEYRRDRVLDDVRDKEQAQYGGNAHQQDDACNNGDSLVIRDPICGISHFFPHFQICTCIQNGR